MERERKKTQARKSRNQGGFITTSPYIKKYRRTWWTFFKKNGSKINNLKEILWKIRQCGKVVWFLSMVPGSWFLQPLLFPMCWEWYCFRSYNPKPLPLSPLTCSPILHKVDHRDLKYCTLYLPWSFQPLKKSLTYRVCS